MKRAKQGIFITFEGTEGSGKSTLIRAVASLLEKTGFKTTQTREPGGNRLAEKIRSLLLEMSMAPLTELFLYEAARAEHLIKTILPSLERGEIVLCDRFTDSTLAYQAYARGLPWNRVKTLNEIATLGTGIDLTVLLNIDPQRGLNRAQNPNRFEAEGLEFQKRVQKGFLKARGENPKRWLTLQVKERSPEDLAETVLKEILKRFKHRLQGITRD